MPSPKSSNKPDTSSVQLIVVGSRGETNIGQSFQNAAVQLGFGVHLCDTSRAFAAPPWLTKFNWHLRGHRPTHLREFSREVVKACGKFLPRWLLSTGLAPIERDALEAIGKIGTKRLNYLNDDPWNSTHCSYWFFEALPLYDSVFSVRRANLADLTRHGCRSVEYLPFGFDPELFYPESPAAQEEKRSFSSDIMFAGGADRDRIPYIAALIRGGFQVALYGNYWNRYPQTRTQARGYADPRMLRLAIGGAKVALCLVRRANRDGNSMRTFEIPAMGTCMLTEDTQEHREIFGEEGKAAIYFHTAEEMVAKLHWLLDHEDERKRLAKASHQLITQGRHTYKDRLITMLGPETVRQEYDPSGPP